ncbi:MAG: DUF4376 domain-containing protein [Sneathiella sp.]
MRVAKLENTKIVNIAVADSLEEGWIDVEALPRAAIGGHLINGICITPPADERLFLDGTVWKAHLEDLLDDNKKHRKSAADKGFVTTTGLPVASDEKAQERLDRLIRHLGKKPAGTAVTFALADGSFVSLDLTALRQIDQEVGDHRQQAFDRQADMARKIGRGDITDFNALADAWV